MDVFFIDDDQVTNRYHEIILAEIASKFDLSLSFFEDPVQALGKLKGRDEVPKFLFLDINMPIMNGWEFLKNLEQEDFPKDVVIILLTTSHNPNNQAKSRRIELVDEYRTKPLDASYFAQIIKKYS